MRTNIRKLLCPAVLAVLAVACADQLGMDSIDGPQFGNTKDATTVASSEALECEVITFDGLTHMDLMSQFSLFGGDVTVTPSARRGNGANAGPRAYDTELWDLNSASALPAPPDTRCVPDQFHFDQQAFINCPECIGAMAVATNDCWDGNVDTFDSDNIGGASITFNFEGGAFTIPSFEAVDCDNSSRNIFLDVGNSGEGLTRIGSCDPSEGGEGYGDGIVSDVTTDPVEFRDIAKFGFLGSGGIDNIEVCRVPEEEGIGRVTGGGGQLILEGDVRVTRGFTLHCDIELANNLEINWEGNSWHIDKLLDYAECTDDPNVEPDPPPAPVDTFVGEDWGRLNGVPDSFVRFTFQDAGEPGGKNDRAGITIWAPGADPATDAPILTVPFDFLDHGNVQFHYDQPHGCNVNKC